MFPQNYDWRYRVISNLLSPRDKVAAITLARARAKAEKSFDVMNGVCSALQRIAHFRSKNL
jgi:hypothetical protein